MTETSLRIANAVFDANDAVLSANRDVPAFEYLNCLLAYTIECSRAFGERAGRLVDTLEYIDNQWQGMLHAVMEEARKETV